MIKSVCVCFSIVLALSSCASSNVYIPPKSDRVDVGNKKVSKIKTNYLTCCELKDRLNLIEPPEVQQHKLTLELNDKGGDDLRPINDKAKGKHHQWVTNDIDWVRGKYSGGAMICDDFAIQSKAVYSPYLRSVSEEYKTYWIVVIGKYNGNTVKLIGGREPKMLPLLSEVNYLYAPSECACENGYAVKRGESLRGKTKAGILKLFGEPSSKRVYALGDGESWKYKAPLWRDFGGVRWDGFKVHFDANGVSTSW